MDTNYFQTDNPALAVVLTMCGVPAPQTPKGPFPAMMLYTREHLQSFGYSGLGIFEAAHRARKEKRTGTRVFQFQRTEILEQVLKGWRKAEDANKAGGDVHLENPNPDDVAQWGFVFNEFRRLMLSNFNIPAYIAFRHGETSHKEPIRENGKTFGGLEVTTTRGSFSIVSIDAPEEIRRQIRV